MDKIFQSIFTSPNLMTIDPKNFLFCVFTALVLGAILAFVYTIKNKYTKSFVVTLALMPAIVCVVIMMVNDNVGAGVAVAGAFTLVRFRSVPGTAREIGAIFMAMGAGFPCGMGYLAFGVLFTLILGSAMLILNLTSFGKASDKNRFLRITIPEDLNYTSVFDDVFEKYTTSHRLVHTKTTNLGSMFKLRYEVTLKNVKDEKDFIDELRIRNGNLEVALMTVNREDGFSEL